MSERTTDEPTRTDRTTDRNQGGKWVSGLIALLGLWLIVAALGFEVLVTNFWNHVIVGVLLAAIGGYNYARRTDRRVGSLPAAAFAALLGLWLIVSPFVIDAGLGEAEALTEIGFWNAIVVGVIVFLLGAYSAYEARRARAGAPARTRTRTR